MYVGGMTSVQMPQRSPVRAGGDVVVQPPVQTPMTYMAPAQNNNQMTASTFFASVLDGVASMFKSVVAFFKNLFGGNTATTTPATPLTAEDAQLAQTYGLLATQENVAAFKAEVQTYAQAGVIGPGTPNVQAVMEMQTALVKLGLLTQASGQYDQATMAAVQSFKQTNGLHQTYKQANGQFAVTGYAELSTQALIKSKVNQLAPTSLPTTAPWDLPAAQRNHAAIAQQYGLYGTVENVDAFCNELKAYQTDGALGPNSNQTQAISDLQTALGRLGYTVPQTGVYDAATLQAVRAFKVANGIHQSYRGADGNFAVNEFAEAHTLTVMMQKLQPVAPITQPVAPVQPVAPAQPAAPGQVNTAAIAAQYHILNTEANIQAFLNEVRGYQTDGALGPGSNQTQPITDLQTVLKKWGFQVTPNGQYDAATVAAVIAFKRQNNLHQSYKSEDGNDAVNEYADKQTLMFIMQKLQAEMAKAA